MRASTLSLPSAILLVLVGQAFAQASTTPARADVLVLGVYHMANPGRASSSSAPATWAGSSTISRAIPPSACGKLAEFAR
ncbi:MAG: hypothetical protein ACT4PM_15275 [Gemmatimonadales bacterium]